MGLRSDRGEWRLGALYIFSSAVTTALANIVIKFFVDKDRPE